MSIIQVILLLTAFPVGILLAKKNKEEIVIGRKYFRFVTILALFLGGYSMFIGEQIFGLTCWYLAILSGISYYKSGRVKYKRSY